MKIIVYICKYLSLVEVLLCKVLETKKTEGYIICNQNIKIHSSTNQAYLNKTDRF